MKTQLIFVSLTLLACSFATASSASAQTTGPAHYALVVGSNVGGDGQDDLRYAETDAASVADLLELLGGYEPARVVRLSQPSPSELRAAVAKISTQLATHQDSGRQTSFLFYYSGHARASSLNLGESELELSSLRSDLEALPATLKVIILDACQSGSFSRIKGVAGAADFSVNSVADLGARGMAVMASSSATELSQESERLRGSYFTHHLLVALRGGGDDNGDGRVTLEEAYRYAYGHTLAATAKTAVGKQHVTLETELRGKGEIPLTYPKAMKSALLLAKNSEGDYLVIAKASGAILAEVAKVSGTPIRLAVAPGEYRVIRRHNDSAVECEQTIRRGQATLLVERGCTAIVLETTSPKGYHRARPWALEFSNGYGTSVDDAFTARLENFGFERRGDLRELHVDLALMRHVSHHTWAGVSALTFGTGDFTRRGDTESQDYSWLGVGVLAQLRYEKALTFRRGRPVLIPFVDVGVGFARATSTLSVGTTDDSQVDYGLAISAAVGAQMMITQRFGLFIKGRFVAAPTIENLLDETHDVGGRFFSFGVRQTFPGQ